MVAGGRRFRAFGALVKDGRRKKTDPLPCVVKSAEEATDVSLAENVHREAMHPADEFEAFQTLIREGSGVEEVAGRHGVTPAVVSRRLKLARVSPSLFQIFRDGGMTIDQLKAFTLTDDHERQERVWSGAQFEWQRSPERLRQALTSEKVDGANDRRVRFVGIDAYREAGGRIEHDLFAPDHAGYLVDSDIVDRLVAAKLDQEAEPVRAEGWGWVETRTESLGWHDEAKFGKVVDQLVPLGAEQQAERDRLAEEQDRLYQENEGEADLSDEVSARIDQIDERIAELDDRRREFRPEEKAIAGAIVTIGHAGNGVIVTRGLVRPEDKKRLAALQRGDAAPGASSKPELSARLIEDMSAHKTAAVRAVLMDRPDTALRGVVYALAVNALSGGWHFDYPTAFQIKTEKPDDTIQTFGAGMTVSPAWVAFEERREKWRKALPEAMADWWGWILDQDTETLLDLLAFCTAATLNATTSQATSPSARVRQADQIAQAVGLDMADWWQPTEATYLGRVKKALVIEAVAEADPGTSTADLATMKRAALIATAEKRLAGTRWVPAYLRTKGEE